MIVHLSRSFLKLECRALCLNQLYAHVEDSLENYIKGRDNINIY